MSLAPPSLPAFLRCPFCGEAPGLDVRSHGGESYYAIGCRTLRCRGNSGNLGPDLAEEVRRWNTRAPHLAANPPLA